MRRRRRNRLIWLAPAVTAGIIALGWTIEILPVTRGATVPIDVRAGAEPGDGGGETFADYFRTGVHLLQVDRPGEAAALFEKARAIRPLQPEVHVNLGYAHLKAGDYRAAEESFRTALETRPAQVNAYYGWAESLEALGDIEAALGAMRTFIHLSPEEDEFVRRARSAVWEWSETLERRRAAGEPPEAAAGDGTPSGIGRLEPADRIDGSVELVRLDGGIDDFQKYAGKTVVLNIWATWCPPCRAELPSLQSLQDILDSNRFAVVGLSIDKDGDFVREFLHDTGVSYPNYIDGGRAIAGRILAVESYPQTLILRPDGSVAERIIGAREWARPDMVDRIRTVSDGGRKVPDSAGQVGAIE